MFLCIVFNCKFDLCYYFNFSRSVLNIISRYLIVPGHILVSIMVTASKISFQTCKLLLWTTGCLFIFVVLLINSLFSEGEFIDCLVFLQLHLFLFFRSKATSTVQTYFDLPLCPRACFYCVVTYICNYILTSYIISYIIHFLVRIFKHFLQVFNF